MLNVESDTVDSVAKDCVSAVLSCRTIRRRSFSDNVEILHSWEWHAQVCVVAFGILGTGMDISTEMSNGD